MSKIVMEWDVHITKVIEVPEDFPEQIDYDTLEAWKHEPDADKKKVSKRSLYAIAKTIWPLNENYDKFEIKGAKMFITEEGKGDDKLAGKSSSKGSVSDSNVESKGGKDE